MNNYFHIGHKKIIDILKKQVKSQKIHHAYIFIGPPNVGKLDLAKYFASLIHEGKNKIKIREKIDKGIHPDTMIVSPQKAKRSYRQSISIEKIKKVTNKINLSPHSSKFKIGIISDAHLMTQEAANAFLKSLEEPPKASVLILTTTNENKILPTIISRCQKLYFGVVKREEILKNLAAEKINKRKAETISRLAAGRMGLAIRFREEKVLKNYQENLSILEKIFNFNDAEKIKKIEEISKTKDTSEILSDWLLYFRDLFAIQKGLDKIVVNFDKIQEIKKWSKKISLEKNKKIIRAIIESQNLLAANANPKLVLENLVLLI